MKYAYIDELEDLEDILHLIEPNEEYRCFTEEEEIEIYETCFHLMEEFINANPTLISDPEFHDIFEDEIYELIYTQFEQDILVNDDELDDIIEKAIDDFFEDYMPVRSYSDSLIIYEPDFEFIDEQLKILRNKPQPAQRTKEWYEFRHKLITASNAYKAFESPATQNQLIFEKCQPLPTLNEGKDSNVKVIETVNVNSTLHHGQKYEPLSVMIYEDIYNTKVGDFGCIQHEKFDFLGASPDGINIDKSSPRYGRMLEIKNIVNREIDGIPKKEYWIQMQLQMEVCDLDECDFLETQFTEYSGYNDYINDKSNVLNGVIAYFQTKEGKPYYVYMPLNIKVIEDINKWEEETIENYEKQGHTWIKNIYWKLEKMSCVLVPRNRQWFKQNIGTIGKLWKTILKERQDGFEHRAPNKRFKKTDENNITNSSTIIKLDSNTTTNNTNNTNSNSSLFKFLQLNLNLNVKKLD
jgi:putative phage-type endonuclease